MRVRVYRALARGLMAGMFKPGEAVTLRTLANRLGTSAMPVREAVSRLIAERALVLLPNRSVIVPRMSRARFIGTDGNTPDSRRNGGRGGLRARHARAVAPALRDQRRDEALPSRSTISAARLRTTWRFTSRSTARPASRSCCR